MPQAAEVGGRCRKTNSLKTCWVGHYLPSPTALPFPECLSRGLRDPSSFKPWACHSLQFCSVLYPWAPRCILGLTCIHSWLVKNQDQGGEQPCSGSGVSLCARESAFETAARLGPPRPTGHRVRPPQSCACFWISRLKSILLVGVTGDLWGKGTCLVGRKLPTATPGLTAADSSLSLFPKGPPSTGPAARPKAGVLIPCLQLSISGHFKADD